MKLKEKNVEINSNKTDNNKNQILKQENISEEIDIIDSEIPKTFHPVNETKSKDVFVIFFIFTFIFILFILIAFCFFTLININNTNIINNVFINNIDVSGLSKEEAKNKLEEYISSSIPDEIKLHHNEFEASIPTSQLSIYFNVDEAVELAYNVGRNENVFKNNLTIIKRLFNSINIIPGFKIDQVQLEKSLNDISNKLPNKMIESSYYIEDSNLIITKGSSGNAVKINDSVDYIKYNINHLNFKNLNLFTEIREPSPINIESIYNEVHKDAVNAYYTQNPFSVYPSEEGLDFAISLENAKNLLQQDQDEYIIPLQVLEPEITTNMIGTEAFPDLLSEFSTSYYASNRNRTTNLILAANKIDGIVIMPNEIFSYNKVVGARTIAAGYKEAPIYVSGKVVDGLGGGICQITTTLYNAVLYANLEIIERSNHQFIPSYVGASRDATVVYGSTDFKFRNNRNYPIKVTCSVSNGIANFKIWGLYTDDDYDVDITSRITGSSSNWIYSEAYKNLYKDGQLINSELISKDTYKKH